MRKVAMFGAMIILILSIGCATNLPTTSSLNDFVMLGTKTNSTEDVSFEYRSNVQDGEIKTYGKDKTKGRGGTFQHTESYTLGRMLQEYIGNKFQKISPDGETKISVTLIDFWLEQYPMDSGGKQFAVAMFGGKLNTMCVAKLKLSLTIEKNGKTYTKNFSATSDEIQEFRSSMWGATVSESIDIVHAENINGVNNKVVMLLNAYFEEIGM